MNKQPIYVLMLILSISLAIAIDKPILQIKNCFNVSIDDSLLQGNYTSISFKDCSKVNSIWYCDCHNVGGLFNLTMQTDGSNLGSRDWRYYRFDIDYNTYTLDHSQGSLLLVDYGSWFNIKSNGIEYLGQNTVEVHDIVYQDREVFRDVIKNVYVDRNITVIEYIENTSKIDDLTIELNNSHAYSRDMTKKYNDLNKVNIYLWIMLVLMCVPIIILLIKLKNK